MISQENNSIIWNFDNKNKCFTSTIQNKTVVKDYGIIINIQNPFNCETKAIIFSGSHTYGTITASKYLLKILCVFTNTNLQREFTQIVFHMTIDLILDL